jgi:hypothetical protein
MEAMLLNSRYNSVPKREDAVGGKKDCRNELVADPTGKREVDAVLQC